MPLKHKILIATASTFLVAASLALAPLAEAKTTLPAPYVSRSVFKSSLLVDSIPWQIITVKNGDSVEKIFKDSGVDLRQLQEILTLNKATNTALNHIKPGQTMALQTTPQHKLLQLKYALGDDRTLWVQRASEGFKTIIKQTALNKPRVDNGIHYVSGTIHH